MSVFCRECGVAHAEDQEFCGACGARLWKVDGRATTIAREDAPGPDGCVVPNSHASSLGVSPADTTADAGYLKRHWRGDLPLPVAYWVNAFLVGIVSGGLGFAVGSISEADLSVQTLFVITASFWGVLLAVNIWQVVGTWRSAAKHQQRGGAAGWAFAAQALLVVSGIRSANVVVTQAIPQVVEFARIASGHDRVGAWQIRVLRNGTEVEVSGGIGFGLAADVRKVLDAQPGVRIVHLNSDGGRVNEARKLRAIIEERRLSTYTATGCASACVLAFIAGQERLLAPDAKLGFHAYAFPGTSTAAFEREMNADKGDFIKRGVNPLFAQRAFSDTTEMWYPETNDMLAAGVVTKLAGIEDVGISGLALDEASLDKALRKVSLFAAVADTDPDVSQRLSQEFRQSVQRGDSPFELRERILPIAEQVVLNSLPRTSDQAVISYVSVFLEQTELLYEKSPEECFAFVTGKGSAQVLRDLAHTLDREMRAAVDVVQGAHTSAVSPPTEEVVAADLLRVLGALHARFGDDTELIDRPETPGIDQAKYCRMVYALYHEALELPRPRAANVLRYLFAARHE